MKLFTLHNITPQLSLRFPAGVAWVETDDIAKAEEAILKEARIVDPGWPGGITPNLNLPDAFEVTVDIASGKVEL